MNTQIELIEGTNRDTSKSQYFTPPRLAERVVEWAGVGVGFHSRGSLYGGQRVLEPSAGNGALVRPLMAAGAVVTAAEVDPRYSDALNALRPSCIWLDNFLDLRPISSAQYDLCVMNPPYHHDGENKFILHALRFAPRVVGIFRADVFYTVSRGEALWKHVRPTRVAFCSRRPWKGAETDYCVLELVLQRACKPSRTGCTLEWWADAW